jgi:hypothetical protein
LLIGGGYFLFGRDIIPAGVSGFIIPGARGFSWRLLLQDLIKAIRQTSMILLFLSVVSGKRGNIGMGSGNLLHHNNARTLFIGCGLPCIGLTAFLFIDTSL